MKTSNRAAEISAALRDEIEGMRAGDKLPSARDLATRFAASPLTISEAVASLAALGLVRPEPGRGTFVTERFRLVDSDFNWQSGVLGRSRIDARRAARIGAYGNPGDIPLSWGYLAPELQPLEEMRAIGARAARDARSWAMAPATGLPELRRVFAADLDAEPGEVTIVAGGQQGLVFVMRSVAEPGSVILTESPSYPGAILAAQTADLKMIPVQTDRDGVIPGRLDEALDRTRAKLIYLQPTYANPTGSIIPAARREEVLEVARRHAAFIVEDDSARHLTLEATPPPPLFAQDPHGHVITVMTLSKSMAPGMRIGAIVARGPVAQRLRSARIADDICVSPLNQQVALTLLTSRAWPRHLRSLRLALTERRDAMVKEIGLRLPDAEIVSLPRGGLHLWVGFREGTDVNEIATRAARDGLLVGDGGHFFVDEAPASFLRLSYGSASHAQMNEGIRRLASLVGPGL